MALSRLKDKVLLVSFVSVWLVVFTLHVRAVFRTGLAQPAVFVSNPADADSYPRIRGFRPEQGGKIEGLEEGDLLIRAGEADLRGIGHIAFDAIAIEQAGRDRQLSVEIERDGQRRLVSIELPRLDTPWMRIPLLIVTMLTAVIVLVRAPPGAQYRLLFVAFAGIAILQSPFHGGSYAETYLSKIIFYSLNILIPPIGIRWALFFPPESKTPNRRLFVLPWLVLLGGAFVRGNYFFSGPVPDSLAPRVVPAWDGFIAVLVLAILSYNYGRSDVIGKRRVKWFLYGLYVGLLPVALTLVMPVFNQTGNLYRQTMVFAALAACVIPLGLLIAIIRHQLFDIDRLISATASYSLLGGSLFAVAMTLIPQLAEAGSAALGVDPQTGNFLLSFGLAMTIIPAHKRLRPAIDQFFFPERRAMEVGIKRLLEDLSRADTPQTLTRQVGDGLSKLIRAEKVVIYSRRDEAFVPIFQESEEEVGPIAVSSPLIAVLERRMVPVAVEGAAGPRTARNLSPFERATLEELGVSVIAPIRGRDGLAALLSLGRKRSGDIYTSTDVAWLAALADKISTQLLRFESLDSSRDERHAELVETLGREPLPEAPTVALSDSSGSECTECGTCYSSSSGHCREDGGALVRLPVPRVLEKRYRLDRRLGSGGMGTVYSATDLSLQRSVAVKLIREELAGSRRAAERFRREARTTAGFTHAHVVTVHDFGVCEGVHPFLVMELLRGRSLAEELKRKGRFDPSEVLEIFDGVCDGVEAAHEQELIHRDLKPANIFLTKKSQGGVKVLDFGLAKALSTSDQHTDTHSGVFVGTIQYMAPERFEGDSVHPAWDIWGLGVIAYEMLTGVRPFDGSTMLECQTKIVLGKFAPITTHLPDAPVRWQEFFERALAQKAEARPSSALAFRAALEEALT